MPDIAATISTPETVGSRWLGSRMAFCIATLLFWMSLFLYVPILPVYAKSIADSYGIVGLVMSSYALPQLLLRIPVGLLYDATARHKLIVMLSIVVAVVSASCLAAAGGALTLFLARSLAGAASAGWVAFTMFFTGYYPQAQTSRAIGTINAVNQAALLAATGLGGVLADAAGYRAVFLVAAGLAGLSLVVMAFARQPEVGATSRAAGGLRCLATSPLLIACSAMAVLMQFATFSSIFGFIPSYGATIGASNSQLGLVTMVALAASSVAAAASARLKERLGYTRSLSLGAALFAGSLLLVPVTVTPAQLALVQVLSGLGRGTLLTILMAMSVHSVPSGARATAMGVFQAVYAIGSLAGPAVSGAIAENLDLGAVFRVSATMALAIVAVAQHPAVRRA